MAILQADAFPASQCEEKTGLLELKMCRGLDERMLIHAARVRGLIRDKTNPSYDREPGTKERAGLIAWKELKHTRYISEGAYCSVHGAQLEGKLVAVKLLKDEHACNEFAIGSMELEIELLRKMSNNHVLKLIGHGHHQIRPFMVTERMQWSLRDQLKSPPSVFYPCTNLAHLSLSMALDYAKQLAKAMVYIHHEAFPGHHLLHRDLKPDNIGIARGRLVLLDFGLSKLIPASPNEDFCPVHMTGKTGTALYMAPEVALSMPYNTKCDVHSYSMVLYELVSHQKPFGIGMDRETLITEVFILGARPPISRKWPAALQLLLKDCWHAQAKCRPDFRTVLKRVESLCAACNLQVAA